MIWKKCVSGRLKRNDTSLCWIQVCWDTWVCRVQVCQIQVCVGYMCVLNTSVCPGQVCVGDLSSGVQLCLMQSEVGFLFVAFWIWTVCVFSRLDFRKPLLPKIGTLGYSIQLPFLQWTVKTSPRTHPQRKGAVWAFQSVIFSAITMGKAKLLLMKYF